MDRGGGGNKWGGVSYIKRGGRTVQQACIYSGRESIPVLKGGEAIDRSKKRERHRNSSIVLSK